MRKFGTTAALTFTILACAGKPAAAQTADFLAAVAVFIGDMSIAGPACGARDRVWAVRLAYKFAGALNGLPPDTVARLPPSTQDHVLDLLAQAQAEARRRIEANRDSYCASAITAERLGHVDGLANGTMAFW